MKHFFISKSSNRLQRRLVIITLGITLGVGILFSTVFTSIYRKYLETSLVKSTDTNLRFLSDSIDSNLQSVYQMVRWAQVNEKIGDYVAETDPESYAATAVIAHNRLTEEYQNSPANTYIQRMVIGNDTNRFIQVVPSVYSSSINLAEAVPKEDYFYTQMETKGFHLSTGFIKDPFYFGYSPQVLPVVRPIYAQYNSSQTGWVYIQISEKLFTTPLHYYSCAEDAGLYLILGDHQYSLTEKNVTPFDMDFDIQYEIKNADLSDESHAYMLKNKETGKESIIIVRNLSTADCSIVQTLSDMELQNQYKILVLLWIVIFGLMLMIGLLMTYVLHRLIAVPVDRIKHQITEVSQGHFAPDTSIECLPICGYEMS